MTDGSFPDRISQLRARWEADPSSRVFLQLAEEYRHLGRVQDALAVLDKGLKEHPGYLSALVAKGRCLLELGESMEARAVLERVVQQDATQMVANKLLVRAYIETGEAERARERLDLYSLLNDSDPEIEDLRRRAKALERAPQAPPVPLPPPVPEVARTAATASTAGTPPADDDPFADLIAAPPRKAEAPADIFDFEPPAVPPPALNFITPAAPPLDAAAPAPVPPAASDDIFDLGPPPAGASSGAADDDLFGLFGDSGGPTAPSRSRYLESLASEGIFDLGEPLSSPSDVQAVAAPAPSLPAELPVFEPPAFAAVEPVPVDIEPEPELTPLPAFEPEPLPAYEPEPLPAPLWEPQLTLEPAAPDEPVFDELPPLVPGESPFPPPAEPVAFSEPLPFAPESLAASPAWPAPEPPELEIELEAEPEEAQPAATVTLGELYLGQGHPREAERIFGEILDREPGHPAALAGLERARVTPPVHRPLDAAQLLEGYDPDDPKGATGPYAKKIHLLTSYLKRLRQGPRSRHVS